MIILGLDPGSQTTGVAVIQVNGNRLTALHGEAIQLKTLALPERLVKLEATLLGLIDVHQPQVLVVEKVFHGVNVKSTLMLGQVRGVVLLCAAKRQVPVEEYNPTEVKKAVVGFGRAEKQQVQMMVKHLLNLPTIPTPHDIADAYALAICHAHSYPMKMHGLNPFGKGRFS
ncbi:MAG: crossover junction endodeoxyribonuclease RuvC [Acidobacteria bacterium]|nr:crossover junction endodeoxyribonuclease RuvC [Acidobacteriota bacterium]MCB9398693.1 crossover junction endodeoxyribonuclease RuvC [Acidobacteriota bacterium]